MTTGERARKAAETRWSRATAGVPQAGGSRVSSTEPPPDADSDRRTPDKKKGLCPHGVPWERCRMMTCKLERWAGLTFEI